MRVLPLPFCLLGETDAVLLEEANCLIECHLILLIVQVISGYGSDSFHLSLIELVGS